MPGSGTPLPLTPARPTRAQNAQSGSAAGGAPADPDRRQIGGYTCICLTQANYAS